MEKKNAHGGSRPGAGRRANDRKCMLSVRISPEAEEIIKTVKNKSEYIDNLIKKDYEISNSRQEEDFGLASKTRENGGFLGGTIPMPHC